MVIRPIGSGKREGSRLQPLAGHAGNAVAGITDGLSSQDYRHEAYRSGDHFVVEACCLRWAKPSAPASFVGTS